MKENDIRKKEVLDKYLELVEKDAARLFDFGSFINICCPACNSGNFVREFIKSGFIYVSCKACSTLFANPRPPLQALKDFYSSSSSTAYYVKEFFAPVAESRREKIFHPRAEYISRIIKTKKNEMIIGDVGAGFGIFLEEIKKLMPAKDYIAIEPSVEMSDICANKGFNVKRSYFEEIDDMPDTFDLLTSFELIEHLFKPKDFFKKAHSLLKPGGHLFFTTLNGRGFDIQTLWERSKTVSPPHHINFFNTYSMRILLEGLGFDIIDISTPGELDWDIVEGMIKNEKISAGKFWDTLAKEGSEECKKELQDWIVKNNLSSHMRVLAKKKGDFV